MFDPGNCQLTIQMTREKLNDLENRLPRTDSTVMGSEALNHQPIDLSNWSIKTEQATEEALLDVESIQRQILGLIPLGMKMGALHWHPWNTS